MKRVACGQLKHERNFDEPPGQIRQHEESCLRAMEIDKIECHRKGYGRQHEESCLRAIETIVIDGASSLGAKSA